MKRTLRFVARAWLTGAIALVLTFAVHGMECDNDKYYTLGVDTTYVDVTDTLNVPCDTVYVAQIDTVFVDVPGDTVVVQPDWECVEECIRVNGLSHTRQCLEGCVPAQ